MAVADAEDCKVELADEAGADRSDSGAHSRSTTSATTVSLTGASFRAVDVAGFIAFQSMRRRNLWWLRGPFLVVELIQLLTFVLDDRFFFSSSTEADVLKAIRYIRNPTVTANPVQSSPITIGIFGGFLMINWVLLVVQTFLVFRGSLGSFRFALDLL